MGKIYNTMTFIYNHSHLKEVKILNKVRFYYTYKYNGGWGTMKEHQKRAEEFIELYNLTPSRKYKSCLDVGCGYGFISGKLSTFIPNVVGIDISNIAIEQAKELFPKVDFKVANIIDFCEGQYDLIIVNSVLNYLTPNQRDKAIDNLWKMKARHIIIVD